MSGSNLAMGVTSDAYRRRTISSWKSVYSSSLSCTRRSRRNDHPFMASKRYWCSALLKRWLSYSGAELVPSAALYGVMQFRFRLRDFASSQEGRGTTQQHWGFCPSVCLGSRGTLVACSQEVSHHNNNNNNNNNNNRVAK